MLSKEARAERISDREARKGVAGVVVAFCLGVGDGTVVVVVEEGRGFCVVERRGFLVVVGWMGR